MASNDSYPDPPISSGDPYSSQNAGFKPYSASGESAFLHRISPESSSLPYAKRPKQNPEMENHRYRRPLQLDRKCRQHCANVLIQSYSIRLRRARYEVHFLLRFFFFRLKPVFQGPGHVGSHLCTSMWLWNRIFEALKKDYQGVSDNYVRTPFC
jgi:hypothetical protein